jgi:hypothetical protein
MKHLLAGIVTALVLFVLAMSLVENVAGTQVMWQNMNATIFVSIVLGFIGGVASFANQLNREAR